MAKKNSAAKTAAAPAESVTDAEIPAGEATETVNIAGGDAPTTEAKIPLAKMRGPRGVPESALISLLVAANPKRPNSKAHTVFNCYVDQMTVGAFCDAVDASVNAHDGSSNKGAGTPNLVYDAAHGFISIEGYTVPGGVIEAKPKAPAKPKVVKPSKAAAGAPVAAATAPADVAAAASEVEAAAAEEVIE